MQFEFVSGNVALDFVGTVAERDRTPIERLTSPEELGQWLVDAGLLSTAQPASQADLARARRLRESIYRYVRSLTDGTAPPRSDRATLNRFASGPPPRPRLTTKGSIELVGDIDAALSAIAAEAIELARPETIPSLRWCADATCTRVFVDRSRGPARRWCGMTSCGNRAKARAHRRKLALSRTG